MAVCHTLALALIQTAATLSHAAVTPAVTHSHTLPHSSQLLIVLLALSRKGVCLPQRVLQQRQKHQQDVKHTKLRQGEHSMSGLECMAA